MSSTDVPARPSPAVLRVHRAALLGTFTALVGTGPLVFAAPLVLGWLVLLPVLATAWVLRVRTTVDEQGLVARTALRSRSVRWDDVDGVRFPRAGWGRAVLRDGSEITLPAVGFNDLRVLAAASGGRVPDPFASAEAARVARDTEQEGGGTEQEGGPAALRE